MCHIESHIFALESYSHLVSKGSSSSESDDESLDSSDSVEESDMRVLRCNMSANQGFQLAYGSDA